MASSLGIQIEVTDHSPEVLKALENAIERGFEAIGMSAQEHATQIITSNKSVDTGRLRNSIAYALAGEAPSPASYSDDQGNGFSYSGAAPAGKNTLYLGTNVEYAKYVEVGSSGRRAKPFMRPAVDNYKDEYRNLMKDSLENA